LRLTKKNAETIEYVRQGFSVLEISNITSSNRKVIRDRMRVLAKMGYLERIGKGQYKATDKPYNVTEERAAPRKEVVLKDHNVPPIIANFLVQNYHLYKRKELARQLGLPKTVLNNYLVEMGLGR